MIIGKFSIKGLTDEEVVNSTTTSGINRLNFKKENTFLDAIKSLAREPMVLLLQLASSIYFISGATSRCNTGMHSLHRLYSGK